MPANQRNDAIVFKRKTRPKFKGAAIHEIGLLRKKDRSSNAD